MNKIKSSVYDPALYSKIKHKSLGSAIGYFFLLILILTALNTVMLSYELLVKVPVEIKNFVSETVNSFPQDLEVNIDDGQVSTNTEEPFFVPFPETDGEYSGMNNLLVIDTKTPFSALQFDQYKTMAWLTKDSLFFQNREYDQRSIPLTDVEDIKINRQFAEETALKISPYLNWVGPFLVLIVFIGMFIGFTFNLIYFLFLAILIFFLSSIFKWGLNYSASYKTAIYASTAAFIIDLVLFNTGFYTGFFGFPFLFTLTALCIATINFQSQDHK